MTLMTESSGGRDDWGKHYDVRGQPIGLIGVKVEMKKGLSTQEKVDLFKRLGELVREKCTCYGSENRQCDTCFDLMQLLHLHRVLIGVEFGALRRREEERLAEEKERKG